MCDDDGDDDVVDGDDDDDGVCQFLKLCLFVFSFWSQASPERARSWGKACKETCN